MAFGVKLDHRQHQVNLKQKRVYPPSGIRTSCLPSPVIDPTDNSGSLRGEISYEFPDDCNAT